MANAILLIVIIAVIMFVLSNLFRAPRNDRPEQQRADARGNPPRRERPSVSDIDRFLEEINRRKKAAPDRQRPPVTESSSAAATRQRRQREARPAPGQRQRGQRPLEMRAEAVRALEAIPVVQAVPDPMPAPVVEPFQTAARAAAQSAETPRKPAPVANLVLPYFRTPQSLQTAFVLQEVLGLPKCKRGRKI